MRGILRRLASLFRPAPPLPPPPVGLLSDYEDDWWGPSWIWVAGDLDDEQGDR
ncbi:hypothetical protein ACIQU4_17370 [Streptomyces sp. NPDC090741]|uniref:hypothetical protein n=1 Tax=Streptomyces sp. NPDC090741 TaxID=3365967 RepID=UPI0038299458